MSTAVRPIEIASKTVLNRVANMPFGWSINPYRGCFHQCVFCYARRTHTFLEADGLGSWGSQIYVKVNAGEVLRRDLRRKNLNRESVAIGTVTDPYQPLEGTYRLMRPILCALADFEIPVSIITRSPLVVRDIDLLANLAKRVRVSVTVSVATMDAALARDIEPTVAAPHQRMRAVRMLAQAGIDAGVALAPILPHITDTHDNIEGVMCAARDANAAHLWHSTLYLQDVTRQSFFTYLREKQPGLVAMYESLYRPTHVHREVKDEISSRVRQSKHRVGLHPLPQIKAEGTRTLRLI